MVIASAWCLEVHGWGWLGRSKYYAEELTEDNIDGYLKEHSTTAVLFYLPWYFHTGQVLEVWDDIADEFHVKECPIRITKIDAQQHSSVGESRGMQSFVNIKFYVDSSVFDYDGSAGINKNAVVQWMESQLNRMIYLTDKNGTDQFLEDHDLAVVGLFPPDLDSLLPSVFARSSTHFQDVYFAESARGDASVEKTSSSVARFSSLSCTTVHVGRWSTKTKRVSLPQSDMFCSSQPRNFQRSDWTDTFSAEVDGKRLVVHRADKASGWDQDLLIKCCKENQPMLDQLSAEKLPVPSIVMVTAHDERFHRYDGPFDNVDALDDWINIRRMPIVSQLSPANMEPLLLGGPRRTPALLLLNDRPASNLETELEKAAKQLRGRVNLVVSRSPSHEMKFLASFVRAETDPLPLVVLVRPHPIGWMRHSPQTFRLIPEGLRAEQVVEFVDGYERGTVTPWIRSERVPTKDEAHQDPVTILVGANFASVADDPTKDVVVMFYAPWCGHSRRLEPTWRKLATRLRHVESLVVAKLDSTRNDVKSIMIRAYPTIVLFPAGSETPKRQISYNDNRELENLLSWLHSHSTLSFDDTPPVVIEHQSQASSFTVEDDL